LGKNASRAGLRFPPRCQYPKPKSSPSKQSFLPKNQLPVDPRFLSPDLRRITSIGRTIINRKRIQPLVGSHSVNKHPVSRKTSAPSTSSNPAPRNKKRHANSRRKPNNPQATYTRSTSFAYHRHNGERRYRLWDCAGHRLPRTSSFVRSLQKKREDRAQRIREHPNRFRYREDCLRSCPEAPVRPFPPRHKRSVPHPFGVAAATEWVEDHKRQPALRKLSVWTGSKASAGRRISQPPSAGEWARLRRPGRGQPAETG